MYWKAIPVGGLKFPEDFYTIVCVQGEKQDQSSIL